MQESATHHYLEARVRPPNPMDVDWSKAPLRFKLYRHCEQIPLFGGKHDVAPTQGSDQALDMTRLGQILYEIYGITRQVEAASPVAMQRPDASDWFGSIGSTWTMSNGAMPLRSVPSGGALYPCEMYVVFGKEGCVPAGVYHYDAIHHALDVLRTGDCSPFVEDCLASSSSPPPMCVLLLTCVFWKNGFKYGAFSYRLQALDAGCIVGQTQVVAAHFGLQAVTHYEFLDGHLNHLIGIEPSIESTYAAIALLPQGVAADENERTMDSAAGEPQLGEQRAIEAEPMYTRFSLGSVAEWPVCKALHEASLIQTRSAFRQPGELPALSSLPPEPATYVQLDAVGILPRDLFWARRARRSAAGQFQLAALTQNHLAQILAASTAGYASDIDASPAHLCHTEVYCVVNSAQDTSEGVYRFSSRVQRLNSVQGVDRQRVLQAAPLATHSVYEANLSLFLVGNLDLGFDVYGDRWYRIQNMEAGIVVQRLYLVAASLGLGCRASLGYDALTLDQALCLPPGFTVLIQVVIAGERASHQHYEQSIPDHSVWVPRLADGT